jgi:hypothetical protein
LRGFTSGILGAYAEERGGGEVLAGGYLQRLHADLVRAPDVSYVRPERVHSSVLPGFFLRVSWLWDRPKLIDAIRELGLI